MSLRHRSKIIEPTLFFVTFSTIQHRNIFNSPETLNQVKDRLLNVCKFKDVKLLAYVIMSNHIHILVFCRNGGPELSKLVVSIKGLVRKDIVGDDCLWEREFDDLVISSEKKLINTISYIHNNPVNAGLVKTSTDYSFSSARLWDGLEEDDRVFTDLQNLTA